MASRLTFVTSAALALALAACGSNETAQDTAQTDAMAEGADLSVGDPMVTGSPAVTAGETPTAAPQFVAAAASGGMYEVESSRLAQQQATNADVKAFADMMIKDHTTANNELKAAAAKATPPVTVPTALDARHQAMLDQLRTAGTNFDRTYMQQQSQAHDETVALLNGYIAGGDNQALRDWATKTLPVVQQHNTRATELAGRM